MFDFAQARKFMIEGQIRTNQITDPGIVSAMSELARESFVPASYKALAYADRELPAADAGKPGASRLLLNPMVLGKLIRAAEVEGGDVVLHIGSATGYGTAILARLAKSVVALEEDEDLAAAARQNLKGTANADVVTGTLAKGYPQKAPFDLILIEGAVEVLPDTLANQIKEGGRLVTIIGAGRTGRGTVFRRTPKGLSGFPVFDAAAPLLPGFTKAPAFTF